MKIFNMRPLDPILPTTRGDFLRAYCEMLSDDKNFAVNCDQNGRKAIPFGSVDSTFVPRSEGDCV
jgi:hypothetical protein